MPDQPATPALRAAPSASRSAGSPGGMPVVTGSARDDDVPVPRRRGVIVAAVMVVAAGLLLRGYVAARGGFYWDDLTLIARASHSPWATEVWATPHDGHLMPGAFALASIITVLFPLNWAAAAASLVVLQAIASGAVLRLLVVLLGWRPIILVPLSFYVFTPMTLPTFAWWAAALNSLPMQAAMAISIAAVVRYCQSGAWRQLVAAVAAWAVGLLFFEKALIIPFLAAAVLWVLLGGSLAAATRQVWVRTKPLWLIWAGASAGYLCLYAAVGKSPPGEHTIRLAWDLTWRTVRWGFLPAAPGGGWHWARWNPGPPFLSESKRSLALGILVVAVIIVLAAWRHRSVGHSYARAALAPALVGAYFLATMLPIYYTRGSENTSLLLAQTQRYLPDVVVAAAVLAAAAWSTTLRPATRDFRVRTGRIAAPPIGAAELALPASRSGRAGLATAGTVIVALIVAASVSTIKYVPVWRDNPTRDYLDRVSAGLRAQPELTMLDGQLSPWVMGALAFPNNQFSVVFDRLPGRSEFANYTTELRRFEDDGALSTRDLVPARSAVAAPGQTGPCVTEVESSAAATLKWDGPTIQWDWIVQINYLASADGEVAAVMEFPTGGAANRGVVRFPVTRGANRVFLELPGSGAATTLTALTPGLQVCVGSAALGLG